MQNPLTRFWEKVWRTSSCWIWLGSRDNGGYGTFHFKGKLVRAHRFSWELINGPIPNNKLILHKCDNPPCINPNHLYVGDYKDNMRDAQLRGRHVGKGRKTNIVVNKLDKSARKMYNPF